MIPPSDGIRGDELHPFFVVFHFDVFVEGNLKIFATVRKIGSDFAEQQAVSEKVELNSASHCRSIRSY